MVTGEKSNKSFTISSVSLEKVVTRHYLDSNNLLTNSSSGNTPVSFEEHEINVNNDKELIRYVLPEYIDRVASEFRELMKD